MELRDVQSRSGGDESNAVVSAREQGKWICAHPVHDRLALFQLRTVLDTESKS